MTHCQNVESSLIIEHNEVSLCLIQILTQFYTIAWILELMSSNALNLSTCHQMHLNLLLPYK